MSAHPFSILNISSIGGLLFFCHRRHAHLVPRHERRQGRILFPNDSTSFEALQRRWINTSSYNAPAKSSAYSTYPHRRHPRTPSPRRRRSLLSASVELRPSLYLRGGRWLTLALLGRLCLCRWWSIRRGPPLCLTLRRVPEFHCPRPGPMKFRRLRLVLDSLPVGGLGARCPDGLVGRTDPVVVQPALVVAPAVAVVVLGSGHACPRLWSVVALAYRPSAPCTPWPALPCTGSRGPSRRHGGPP